MSPFLLNAMKLLIIFLLQQLAKRKLHLTLSQIKPLISYFKITGSIEYLPQKLSNGLSYERRHYYNKVASTFQLHDFLSLLPKPRHSLLNLVKALNWSCLNGGGWVLLHQDQGFDKVCEAGVGGGGTELCRTSSAATSATLTDISRNISQQLIDYNPNYQIRQHWLWHLQVIFGFVRGQGPTVDVS